MLFVANTEAATRFTSNYPCQDNGRTCVSSGVRTVDGFQIHKDCWEYSYSKTCNYPSKNDCSQYSHCYLVQDLPCLLRDSYGYCVNLHKEFSCKSWTPAPIEAEIVRTGLVEKTGKDRLVCKGVPCIDGNCVDKAYMTDGDMMDSVSKLYAVSQMKGAKDLNFKLFEGFGAHCSKKATSYTNCCSTALKGWGKNLGAGCTKDEQDLIDKRQKNLCVYVGKVNKQKVGVTTVVKHHYCCFGGMLNKVIQVEGRKQLGINFGSGGNTDCRGLTLAEIMRLDFDKMDFSEFFADILKRMKIPKIGDITARVDASLPNIRKYDGNKHNKENRKTGVNESFKDDSFEADEERRIAEENRRLEEERARELARLEEERKKELAKQEAIRAEKERLAAVERARQESIRLEQIRQAQIAEAKRQRKIAKEYELAVANRALQDANKISDNMWSTHVRKFGYYANGHWLIGFGSPVPAEITNHKDKVVAPLQAEVQKIIQVLQTGNY